MNKVYFTNCNQNEIIFSRFIMISTIVSMLLIIFSEIAVMVSDFSSYENYNTLILFSIPLSLVTAFYVLSIKEERLTEMLLMLSICIFGLFLILLTTYNRLGLLISISSLFFLALKLISFKYNKSKC